MSQCRISTITDRFNRAAYDRGKAQDISDKVQGDWFLSNTVLDDADMTR